MNNFFPILIAGLFIFSCSLLPESAPLPKSSQYSIDFNDHGWKQIDPQGSDYAFVHKRAGSIITANSICKKSQPTSLDVLLGHILVDINQINIKNKSEINFKNRLALRASIDGEVDGVPISLEILTFNRNHCTYDFVLIKRDRLTANDVESFNSFLESIGFVD